MGTASRLPACRATAKFGVRLAFFVYEVTKQLDSSLDIYPSMAYDYFINA
jgi:hypothetical protein